MKIEDMLYHPTLVKISYKIYEVSVALGFAVMPPPQKEYSLHQVVQKNLKDLDKIVENIKALDLDYDKIVSINNPKGS